MSVVAWDGKTLAADCQSVSAGMRTKVSKIFKQEDGTLLALTGGLAEGLAMVDWYKEGADLLRYPSFQSDRDRWCRLIVVMPEAPTLLVFEQAPAAIYFPKKHPIAFGAGRDFAMGALLMGASAVRAVEATNELCTDCGMGVEFYQTSLSIPSRIRKCMRERQWLKYKDYPRELK